MKKTGIRNIKYEIEANFIIIFYTVGITINTLWIRLFERRNFSFSLDDNSKKYLWSCILNLQVMATLQQCCKMDELNPFHLAEELVAMKNERTVIIT